MNSGPRLSIKFLHPSAGEVICNAERWQTAAPDKNGKRNVAFFDGRISGAEDAAQDTVNYLNAVAADMGRPRPHGISSLDKALGEVSLGACAQINDAFRDRYIVAHADVLEEARKRLMKEPQGDKAEAPYAKKPYWTLKPPYGQAAILNRARMIWHSVKGSTLKKIDLAQLFPEDTDDQRASVAADIMRMLGYAAAELRRAEKDAVDPVQEGNVITTDAPVLEKARQLVERNRRR